MAFDIPIIAVKFVERVEGCKLVAYQDEAGVWTIFTGHTGPDVVEGRTGTQEEADAVLAQDMQIAAQRLNWAIGPTAVAGLNTFQYSALLSFVFNEGEKADWSVWADIRQGKLDLVPAELKKFDYAGGKVSHGLDNRRSQEVDLWTGTDPLCKLYPLATAV